MRAHACPAGPRRWAHTLLDARSTRLHSAAACGIVRPCFPDGPRRASRSDAWPSRISSASGWMAWGARCQCRCCRAPRTTSCRSRRSFPHAATASIDYRAEGWVCADRTWRGARHAPLFPARPRRQGEPLPAGDALLPRRTSGRCTRSTSTSSTSRHAAGRAARTGSRAERTIGGVRPCSLRIPLPKPGEPLDALPAPPARRRIPKTSATSSIHTRRSKIAERCGALTPGARRVMLPGHVASPTGSTSPLPVLRIEIVRIVAPLAMLGFMSGRLAHADEWIGDAGFRVPDLGGDWRSRSTSRRCRRAPRGRRRRHGRVGARVLRRPPDAPERARLRRDPRVRGALRSPRRVHGEQAVARRRARAGRRPRGQPPRRRRVARALANAAKRRPRS